jgi:hypothetical protein
LQKDTDDLANALPLLSPRRAEWLLDCLRRQYSDGHAWIGLLEGRAGAGEPED